jgi:hypothetical protein
MSGADRSVFPKVKQLREYLTTLPAKTADYVLFGTLTIVLSSALAVAFKEWLKTEHSLQMYGWFWVVGAICLGGLPALIVRVIERKQPKLRYQSEADISVALEHRLRSYDNQREDVKFLDFREFDRKLGLPKGSAKRLLPGIVEKDEVWHVKHRGDELMTIIRDSGNHHAEAQGQTRTPP